MIYDDNELAHYCITALSALLCSAPLGGGDIARKERKLVSASLCGHEVRHYRVFGEC